MKPIEIVGGYLSSTDWRCFENSNINFSLGGLMLHNSGALIANYWLDHIYSKEISKAHRDADIHIHDLGMLSPYCAGWSLRQLLEEGLGGVTNRIKSKPAKYLNTVINQMVNFLGIMQNEWAGAQAFSSFDTYLAPFVRGMYYCDIKANIESFIYGVNTPSRWGCQAPFTNITLDWVVPEDMKYKNVIVGGEDQPTFYGEYQHEMDLINKAFLEVLIEGDADGRAFQYPIPTYNITKDFNWESENAKLLFEMTSKYGTPYFQNFINSDLDPSDVRSMCCRLQLDKRELRKKGGGLFGADEFTGSLGVVTINLPKIGYLANTQEDLYNILQEKLDLATKSLLIKRTVIEELFEQGLYPYSKRYLSNFNNHFNTIGIVGMHELCLNFLGKGIDSESGYKLAIDILKYIRNYIQDIQEETGKLFNLEATPAESTSYRLAMHDKRKYKNIITSGTEEPYYTNSTNFPVGYTDDIFEALEGQEGLQKLYTGGTVFHTFLGEAIEDWRGCKELVKTIAENYKIPYFTITPTFSICPIHGYLSGEHFNCPKCLETMKEKYNILLKEQNNERKPN